MKTFKHTVHSVEVTHHIFLIIFSVHVFERNLLLYFLTFALCEFKRRTVRSYIETEYMMYLPVETLFTWNNMVGND